MAVGRQQRGGVGGTVGGSLAMAAAALVARQLWQLGNSVAAAAAAWRQHGSCDSLAAVWRQVWTTATTTTMTETNTTIKQCTGEGGG